MTGGYRSLGRLVKDSYKTVVKVLTPPPPPPKKLITGGKELDDLIDHWWNEEGLWKHTHKLNTFLMPAMQECLVTVGTLDSSRDVKNFRCKTPFEGVTFLVVGCEGGIISECIVTKGGKVVGIDACQNRINVAKAHRKISGLQPTYFCSTMEQFAEDNSETRFDVVVLPNVIERIENADKEAFLNSAIRLMKPQGSIFVVTVNRTIDSGMYSEIHEMFRQDCQQGTYLHHKFMHISDLAEIFEKNKIEVRSHKGLDWCTNFDKWTEILHTKIHYFVHGVKTSETSL